MKMGKKPGLALVIAAGDKDDEAGEMEESEDYSEAVGELFDAVKSGDKAAFSEAFKAAVMSCKE